METWTLGLDDEFLAHTYPGNWRTTQAVGFFPSRGAFFREFRHSAQQGRSMDFRQFAGVGVNQLRARNSRGNNGQDPELGTTAILPGVRSREQGLYTGSVYPAFTSLQVCIQLFCTPHHAFLQCQLYILRCLLRDRDSVPSPSSKSVYLPHLPPSQSLLGLLYPALFYQDKRAAANRLDAPFPASVTAQGNALLPAPLANCRRIVV